MREHWTLNAHLSVTNNCVLLNSLSIFYFFYNFIVKLKISAQACSISVLFLTCYESLHIIIFIIFVIFIEIPLSLRKLLRLTFSGKIDLVSNLLFFVICLYCVDMCVSFLFVTFLKFYPLHFLKRKRLKLVVCCCCCDYEIWNHNHVMILLAYISD